MSPSDVWTITFVMNQCTRKVMTIHESVHPRDYIDRPIYVKKVGGRALGSVDASIWRLEDYMKKSKGTLITVIRNKKEHKDLLNNNYSKTKCKEKQMYYYLERKQLESQTRGPGHG